MKKRLFVFSPVLTDAGVDSLGILGSTGSYAYLSREQRRRVVQVAKAHAGSIR